MANFVYDKARQRFLEGSIAWLTDTIKVQLISLTNNSGTTLHTPNSGTHQFLSDVASAARISTPQTLGSKTSTNGNALGGSLVFPAVVPVGETIEAYIVYKDTGSDATSPLIAFVDTVATNVDTGLPGLPVTANGGPINLTFPGTRIFRI